MTTLVRCVWDFNIMECDECGEDADPNAGGALVEWEDPHKPRAILCGACMELYKKDITSIILQWDRG